MRTQIITLAIASFVSFAGVYSSAVANFSGPVTHVATLACADEATEIVRQKPGQPLDMAEIVLKWRKATGTTLSQSRQRLILKQFGDAAKREAQEGLLCATPDEDAGRFLPDIYFDR